MYAMSNSFPRPLKPTPVALAGPCLDWAPEQPQCGNRHTLAEQRVR
jgi:hypothetical protein